MAEAGIKGSFSFRCQCHKKKKARKVIETKGGIFQKKKKTRSK
jgi:hypothetical protein